MHYITKAYKRIEWEHNHLYMVLVSFTEFLQDNFAGFGKIAPDGHGELQGDVRSWWRHQMETFSALLAICAGNSMVTGEFPAQRPVTRSFDFLFFDLRLNKRLSKQSWGWWFETLSCPLWRHSNVQAYVSHLPITQLFVQERIQEDNKKALGWYITGPLCCESTGNRWIPTQRANKAETASMWWCLHKQFITRDNGYFYG